MSNKKTYSEIIGEAYGNCGGKSKPKFGDVKEFAAHLSEVLAASENDLKTFIKNGKRRLRQGVKRG